MFHSKQIIKNNFFLPKQHILNEKIISWSINIVRSRLITSQGYLVHATDIAKFNLISFNVFYGKVNINCRYMNN